MSRITFTKEIVQDAQRLVEQLNLMMTQVDSVSKPVNALRAQVTNINNTITGMGVVKIQNNAGSLIGARDTLQFLNGSLISWNIIDDPVNARVQIAPIVSGAHDLTAGTSLQITAGTGVGAVLQNLTLNTIQGIRTSDAPTFAGIFLTGMEIIFGGNTIRMFDVTDTFYSSFSLATLTANRGLTIPNVTGVIATVDGGQTFTVANWQATPIGIGYGGTGQTTATLGFNALSPLTTKGDVIGHDGTNNIRVGVGTDGWILTADSAQTVGFKWAAPGAATAHDILSATHTDTLAAAVVLGDIIHGNATPKWARLAGNITTTKKWLSQTGTGAVSAAPTWESIVAGDVGSAANLSVGNSLSVTAGSGTGAVLTAVTLDTIQDIRTSAVPQFQRLGLGASADATATLKLEANANPMFIMYRTSNALTLTINQQYCAQNASSARTIYAQTSGYIVDNTAASEDGAFIISTMRAGTLTEAVRIKETGTVLVGSASSAVSTVKMEVWSTLLLTDNTNTSSTNFPTETNVAAVLARTGYNGTPSASIALGALNHDAVNDGAPFRYILSTDGGATATGLVFSKETWAASVITRTALMRLNATGLGIGASPNARLTVSDGTVTYYVNPASAITYTGNTSNHPLGFVVNNVEGMRLSTAGLMIGDSVGTASRELHIKKTSANAGIQLQSSGGSGKPYGIMSTTIGSLDIQTDSGTQSLFRIEAGGTFLLWKADTSTRLSIDNGTAGVQTLINLTDAGTVKWQIGKQTDNSFFLWDNANTRNVFVVSTSGLPAFLQLTGFAGKTVPTAAIHIGTSTTVGHIRMDGIAGNPASPTDGDHWYNTTQESHRFRATVGTQGLVGLVYANTADSNTVAGNVTLAETDFDKQYTFPASSLTVGKTIRLTVAMDWSQVAGTISLSVYLGANKIHFLSGLTLTSAGTDDTIWLQSTAVVRTAGSSGVVQPTGVVIFGANKYQFGIGYSESNTGTVTLNTTTTATMKVAVQFNNNNAANNLTIRNITIEVLD